MIEEGGGRTERGAGRGERDSERVRRAGCGNLERMVKRISYFYVDIVI